MDLDQTFEYKGPKLPDTPPPRRTYPTRIEGSLASAKIKSLALIEDSDSEMDEKADKGQASTSTMGTQQLPNRFLTIATRNADQIAVCETFSDAYDTELEGEMVCKFVANLLPVGLLCRRSVLCHPRLFMIIYQFLQSRKIQFDSRSSYPMAIEIVRAVYSEDIFERNFKSLELSLNVCENHPENNNQTPDKSSENDHRHKYTERDEEETSRKLVNNLSQRFSSKKQFSGTENLHNYVAAYKYAIRDLNLSNSESLDYLHYLFKDNALIFYQDQIEGQYHDFDRAIDRIEEEFNPSSRQYQLYRTMRSLNIKTFSQNGLTEGLDKLNQYILNNSSRIPIQYRNDTAKMEFLRDAVSSCEWARVVLVSTAYKETNYQELLSRLHAAVITDISAGKNSGHQNSEFATHYTSGQRMYGNRNRNFQPNRAKQRSYPKVQQNRFNSNKSRSCWNCGLTTHTLYECKKPFDMKEIVKRRLEFYSKRHPHKENQVLKRVLYEVSTICYSTEPGDDESEEETLNFDSFHNALSNTEEEESSAEQEEHNTEVDITPVESELFYTSLNLSMKDHKKEQLSNESLSDF